MIRTQSKVVRCVCIILLALLILSPLSGLISVNAETASTLTDDMKLMGYGYNVTAGVPLEGATSLNLASPILDMTDPELLAAVATFEIGSHTKANSTSSASAREMASSIGSVIGGGLNIGISMVTADINFLFQRNTYSEKTVQEYYEYYYEEIVRRAVIIQMPTSEIKEHLSDAFLSDLKEVDSPKEAEALIQKYGTHLMTGYNLGGRLSFTNYRQSTSASEELQTQVDLKAKIGASVKTVSGGVDFSFGEQFTNREFTETATSEYSFQSIGGEAITALTIDHVFQYNPSALDGKGGFVYNSWVQSVNNGTRLAILGLANGASAIPIWDLIPNDGSYALARQCVMEAYIDVCGDKYSEYCEKYPYLKSNFNGINGATSEAEIKGYYYSVNGNYYYVDEAGMNNHSSVAPGSTLFLDVSHSISADKIIYTISDGADYATVLDEKNGIIQINNNAGAGKTIVINVCDGDQVRDFYTVTTAALKYSGGNGTEQYPYLISSAAEFKSIITNRSDWTKHFRLTRNIDFGGETIGGIGDATTNFSGVFDGNYCYIAGYKINAQTDNAVGLFKYSNGTIKNLTVGANGPTTEIKTGAAGDAKYAGALIGCMNGGRVENCKVQYATVFTQYTDGTPIEYTATAGGLIGVMKTGTVVDCCASVGVTTVAYVVNTTVSNESKATAIAGGLIGSIEGGSVSDCWVYPPTRIQAQAEGYKEAYAYQGMLAGKISGKSSVSNCVTGLLDTSKDSNQPVTKVDEKFLGIIGSNGKKYFGAFIGSKEGKEVSFSNCTCQSDKSGNDKAEKAFQGDSDDNVKVIDNRLPVLSDTTLDTNKWEANGGNSFPVLKKHVSGYVTIKVEQGDITTYAGSYWNPLKIVVSRVEGGSTSTRVAFTTTAPTGVLDKVGAQSYTISAFNKTATQKLNVINKDVIGVYVDNTDDTIIYCGETFTVDTHASDVEIYGILSNGQKLLIAVGDKLQERELYVNYPDIDIDYTLETCNIGKNKVIVSLNKNLKCEYVIECKERTVTELEVITYPTKTEYTVGSVFESAGIRLRAIYDDGYTEEVDINDIEYIGDVIYYGEGAVRLAYKNYTACEVTVIGVCNESSHSGGSATCDKLAICELCGEEYGDYGAHVGGTATCSKLAECIACGEEYGKYGDHVYDETVVDPTCETDGYTRYTCVECDRSYKGDIVDANGHRGGVATCIARAICTICENSYGALAPHAYGVTVHSPDCTKAGYTEYYCAVCEHSYKENYTSALGHSGGVPDDDGAAQCEKCGADYKPQSGGEGGTIVHNYVPNVVAPTCKASGYTEYICTICNHTYKDNYVSAVEHSGGVATCVSGAVCSMCGEEYGSRGTHKYVSTVIKPTCVDNGYTEYNCSVCNASYQYGETPAIGHVGGKADCVNPAICTRCGDYYGEVAEHRYVSAVVAPTCTEDGYTKYTCSVCNNTYHDTVIRAIGHDYPDVSCQGTKCRNNCGTSMSAIAALEGFATLMLNVLLVPLGIIFKRRFF